MPSAATPHTTASTTKTLAAFSALHHLDPTATLTTSALLGADNQTLYLDSEGDLLLGIGTSDEVEVSGRAACRPSRRTRPRPWRSAASRR